MRFASITEDPGERADLARFGYSQELHRRVGAFASFAAGFSFVSILTTVFQLFFLGFGFGGAAFFWTLVVAVKDNIDVAGLPTTAAAPSFAYQPKTRPPSPGCAPPATWRPIRSG